MGDMMKNGDMVTLKRYADGHDLDDAQIRKLRRIVRDTDGPMSTYVMKFGNTWAIEHDAPLPDLTLTTRGTKRVDGRSRYIVYMTTDERDDWLTTHDADTLVDVNARNRARRAAKSDNDDDG